MRAMKSRVQMFELQYNGTYETRDCVQVAVLIHIAVNNETHVIIAKSFTKLHLKGNQEEQEIIHAAVCVQ